MKVVCMLLYLGKRGAINSYITVTTPHMGSELRMSQQSVSRWLIRLEHDGMIARKQGIRGYMIRITPKGMELLVKMRNDLNDVLAVSGKMVMHGKVVSGMQDGKYYLQLKGYREGIKSRLGFEPYAGTLNIELDSVEDTQCKERLCAMPGIEMEGFREGDRIFGSIKCFPCIISGINGAVLIPERSHYGFDVLEIISPQNIRGKLKLSDGNDVKVEIEVR